MYSYACEFGPRNYNSSGYCPSTDGGPPDFGPFGYCPSGPSGYDICDYCDPPTYKEPMPWIGVYVAAASLVCSLAMAADVFLGFRHKKLWFPCKFFTLNATSLTLLAVATKLSVDLTTPMEGKIDQLAKLSSTVFMSTIMGNFMPSLGLLDDKEIFTNIIALGIILITIVVNVCIQLGTGIIPGSGTGITSGFGRLNFHGIWFEDILAMFFMLVLFVIMSFSALTVSPTKKYIELKYGEIHEIVSSEQSEETGNFTSVEKLKRDVKKYWMMAATGSPQFVIGRSVTCSASGAICFLTALILVEATLRILSTGIYSDDDRNYCVSDYKGSIFLIFVIQSIGVGVGTISMSFRWFTAVSSKRSRNESSNSNETEFKIENYGVQRLLEWKEKQLPGENSRKLVQVTKNLILDICIRVQIMIVKVSKSVEHFSILFICPLILSCIHWCKQGWKTKLLSNNHSTEAEPEASSIKLDLRRYALNLEGEVELPERMLKDICDVADHLIQKGNKQQPNRLIELLKKAADFKGIEEEVSSIQVPSLDFADLLNNCWTLPVLTLTSIAIAIANCHDPMVILLLQGVREGLFYISHVEKIEHPKRDLINIRKAADLVWLGVKRHHRKSTLKSLADRAENIVRKFENGSSEDDNLLNRPIEVIAATLMFRVSDTLLRVYDGQTNDILFKQLFVMIADRLRACLANLPRVITIKCCCSAIEKREESVQEAAHLLGETEEILNILQHRQLSSLDPHQGAHGHIDERRALIKQTNLLASSESGESHIEIEEA